MFRWDSSKQVTGFNPTEPNLSRSSTLVSNGEDNICDNPVAKLNTKEGTEFHKSFLHRYCPDYSWKQAQFEEIELAESQSRESEDKKTAAYVSQFLVNGWMWEIFSWFISALCMAGIALVLGLYNNKRVPVLWPLGITLNAYISVLSAVAKYALAVPVDEALGQLRWLYFTRAPKRLIDFERFDDATRGPWGALALLVYTKARTLASLGASITLLTLALDPFFQQLVSYPQRPGLSQRGTIPRSVLYSTKSGRFVNASDSPMMDPDLELITATQQYMIQSDPVEVHEITPFCASDNCEWPAFNTLAICSECVDISALLQFGCLQEDGYWRSEFDYSNPDGTNASFTSCGYFFNATSPDPMLMTGYATNSSINNSTAGEALISRLLNFRDPRTERSYWDHSLNFKHIPTPIINFATVTVLDATSAYLNKTPIAHECVLHWCTKTIAAKYSKGIYAEQVLSTFTNHTMIPNPLKLVGEPAVYDYLPNITISPPGQAETFTVANDTALQTIFTFDVITPLYLTQANISAAPMMRTYNDMNSTTRARSLKYTTNHWASKDIPQYIADLASTMTNVIRAYPGSSELVLGTGSLESYVHISWGWFALPVSLLLSTLVFLIGTIVRSHKANIGIFKTSSLAILANGLDDVTKGDVESGTLLGLFNNACNVKVALKAEKGKVRLKAA